MRAYKLCDNCKDFRKIRKHLLILARYEVITINQMNDDTYQNQQLLYINCNECIITTGVILLGESDDTTNAV